MHFPLLVSAIAASSAAISTNTICSPVPGGASSLSSCTKEDNLGNCSFSGDTNTDVDSFLLNKRTLQEYRDGDPVISGCPSEWRLHNVRKGLEEWIKVMSLDKDPFWMMHTPNNYDVPLRPLDGFVKLGLGYKDNRLLFLTPGQKDETTVYFDNELQRILEHCPFEGIVPPQSIPAASYHQLSVAKQRPMPIFLEGRTMGGLIQGPVRIFGKHVSDPACHSQIYPQLAFIGSYRNSQPHGYCYKGLKGGAWLYGKVDEKGEFTGDNIAYIYQDLTTALRGKFREGVMVAAREVEVRGFRCERGIVRIKFSKPSGPVFHYKPPTTRSFGDQPDVTDPLDNKYVYSAPSIEMPIAGEGLFAAIDIPPHTTISLISGFRKNKTQYEHDYKMYVLKLLKKRGLSKNSSAVKLKSLMAQIMESDKNVCQVNYHCNLIVDIPPKHISTYKATLGHKANHHFEPNNNVVLTWIDSPRFGPVAALTSTKWIKKGEEIFNNYNYNVKDTTLPWYKETYMKLIHEKESRTVKF